MTLARQHDPGDIVPIPGGRFVMGSDRFYPEERPVRPAEVGAFLIDRHPVTNAALARFVAATGHVTQAERMQPRPSIPGHMVEPCSAAFTQPPPGTVLKGPASWWRLVPGACWKHPTGPASDLAGLEDHPVVYVALADALAYAEWAAKALPTEAEWECAACGELAGAEYAWGDRLTPGGRHIANTWQGAFPFVNDLEDGFARTSPVGSFPANGYELYDMIGNVWECELAPLSTGHLGVTMEA